MYEKKSQRVECGEGGGGRGKEGRREIATTYSHCRKPEVVIVD